MNYFTSIIAVATTVSTIAYGLLVPGVSKDKKYYQDIFEKNTVIQKYYELLKLVLSQITYHFGKPFSNQSHSLCTNLAVFYSFAVFLIIYVFTGYGKLGALEILNEKIPYTIRLFLSLIGFFYFRFLFYKFKNIRLSASIIKPTFNNVLFILVCLIPSFLIAVIVSFEWHSVYKFGGNIKSFSIVALALTLSAAILGFSGDGLGSKKGYGAFVFNLTFLSMVGVASVISSFLQFKVFGYYSFISLIGLIIIFLVSMYLWKKRIQLYYFNISLLIITIVIRNIFPDIFGMDIISATLIYFFIALPFINGLLDYISLSISRILADKILLKARVSVLITHILLDLFIAFVLLFFLILAFIFVTWIFNTFFAKGSGFYISIDSVFNNAIHEPLSPSGLWLYTMMFSTLLPTFIHLFIAITSLILLHPFEKLRNSILEILKKRKLFTEDKIKVVLYIYIARIGSIAFSLVILVFMVEFTGPVFMSWIKELTNLILSI